MTYDQNNTVSDIHNQAIIAAIGALSDSPQYLDLTIICVEESFHVNRAIVCPRSNLLKVACSESFEKGQSGIITLDHDDQSTIRRMVTYLYKMDYDDGGDAASSEYDLPKCTVDLSSAFDSEMPQDEIAQHSRLMSKVLIYAIADKYDISMLQSVAQEKVTRLMYEDGPNKKTSFIMDAIFETTPASNAGLREVAMAFCTKHIEKIAADSWFKSMLRDHGALDFGAI